MTMSLVQLDLLECHISLQSSRMEILSKFYCTIRQWLTVYQLHPNIMINIMIKCWFNRQLNLTHADSLPEDDALIFMFSYFHLFLFLNSRPCSFLVRTGCWRSIYTPVEILMREWNFQERLEDRWISDSQSMSNTKVRNTEISGYQCLLIYVQTMRSQYGCFVLVSQKLPKTSKRVNTRQRSRISYPLVVVV